MGVFSYSPDVYFIVLDQYPRADVLRNIFYSSNRRFLNDLRKMGFYVADRGACNYPRTIMFIASTLNLAYLDDVLGAVPQDCTDLNLPAKNLAHNAVFSFFREHSYWTVVFAPEYGAGRFGNVDLLIDSAARLSEFDAAVIEMTPIQDLLRPFSPEFSTAELRRRHILYTLDRLQKLPGSGLSPMFVYAHILCPHPPIVFGPEGEPVAFGSSHDEAEDTPNTREFKRYYAGQVAFISQKIKQVVAAILARPSLRLDRAGGERPMTGSGEEAVPFSWPKTLVHCCY